jgi:hypothetical protein
MNAVSRPSTDAITAKEPGSSVQQTTSGSNVISKKPTRAVLKGTKQKPQQEEEEEAPAQTKDGHAMLPSDLADKAGDADITQLFTDVLAAAGQAVPDHTQELATIDAEVSCSTMVTSLTLTGHKAAFVK